MTERNEHMAAPPIALRAGTTPRRLPRWAVLTVAIAGGMVGRSGGADVRRPERRLDSDRDEEQKHEAVRPASVPPLRSRRGMWSLVKATVEKWLADKAPRLGAGPTSGGARCFPNSNSLCRHYSQPGMFNKAGSSRRIESIYFVVNDRMAWANEGNALTRASGLAVSSSSGYTPPHSVVPRRA
jgi:surface antigen